MEYLGQPPFPADPKQPLPSKVGTYFLKHNVLVTLPTIHAMQRVLFIMNWLNPRRWAEGKPHLTPDEEKVEMAESVDLFFEAPNTIIIRPDPDHMDLAFEADQKLTEIVGTKRNIKFLFIFNPRIQQPIKARGEWWRISAMPRPNHEFQKLITDSRAAIDCHPIYYYNRASGTRYVTYQEFESLAQLPAAELAKQLTEISVYVRVPNRLNNKEIDFFKADPHLFNAYSIPAEDYLSMPEEELLKKYRQIKDEFFKAVPPQYQQDNVKDEEWCTAMFKTLVKSSEEFISDEKLLGLSAEFFMQIEWLPGARFEYGEVLFDSMFNEPSSAHDKSLPEMCDPKVKGFILNFIREFGDLDYVNVGRISHPLNRVRPLADSDTAVSTDKEQKRRVTGRRDVYIAEIKPKDQEKPVIRFMRLLKWGVRERLDEGKDLLASIMESLEYVDYSLDRRHGCRQLGMNLPPKIRIYQVREPYHGINADHWNKNLMAFYAERDFIRGVATDKVQHWRLARPDYALRFACLLGKAAASNMIVGRTYENGTIVVFDDGDEVAVEDENGKLEEIVAGDHSGAFGEWKRPLVEFAPAYAECVNKRAKDIKDMREFAVAFLDSFRDQFLYIQREYRRRSKAFNSMFDHTFSGEKPPGCFADRWSCVLERLDRTSATEVTIAIRNHIHVLNPKA